MAEIVVWAGGYVGLTCAVHFAKAGHKVLIYDPDENIVAAINSGKPKAGEFLSYLGGFDATSAIRATADVDDPEIQKAKIQIIAVPTERNGRPADDIAINVLERLWVTVEKGTVIIVESTLIPGTIDKFLALPEEGEKLEVGKDVFLAVCPRRDWFADPDKNLGNLKRIVGGVTTACTERACSVLSAVSEDIEKTDYRTAEITKSLENALLHVQLVMVNQLAVSMPDRNVAEALRLASTHWRLTKNMHLNAGAGGRCVPLGSKYLEAASTKACTVIREVNASEIRMRSEVASVVMRHAKNIANPKILVIGVAYRPNFKDAGMSPGLDVARHLVNEVCTVHVKDPMWTKEELEKLSGLNVWDSDDYSRFDVIVLATPHKEIYVPSFKEGQIIVDAQGAWKNFEKTFFKYVRIGEPGWLGV